MRYLEQLGLSRIRVDVAPDGSYRVDDVPASLEVRTVVPGRHWSAALDGRVHEVVVLGRDPLRLLVDGRELRPSVADERVLLSGAPAAAGGRGQHELRAPMPGLLKAVHVSEGELVERDAPVATLEAMKMENELRSPARARVARIAIAAGTKVEGGALLVVLSEE